MTYFLYYVLFATLIVGHAFKNEVMSDPRARNLKPVHYWVGCLMIAWIALPAAIFRRILR